MTVFYCSKCGVALTPDLVALDAVPDLPDESDRDRGTGLLSSTVPRGRWGVEPEPWGAPYVPHPDQENGRTQPRGPLTIVQNVLMASAGPRGDIVVHPEDVPSLQPLPGNENGNGCCGPAGNQGRNRMCACGSRLATLAADCMGAYELHVDPVRVYPFDASATPV